MLILRLNFSVLRMKTKYVTILLLAILPLLALRLADDPFDLLLEKLRSYNDSHPQEKVHLHLDKPYYTAGDNIWFKAYILDNHTNLLSAISSVLYVELIDERDSVKQQLKLPVVSGISWGDFKLTDTLPEGNYRIRAYTQWMRNAGPEYFFDKTILIGNGLSNRVFTHTTYLTGKKNERENPAARVRFTDKQGNPYTGRPVAYEIFLKDKSAGRGKSVTDTQGEVTINFQAGEDAGMAATGSITAKLTLPDKQVAVKSIPVKTARSLRSVQFFPESGDLVENLPSKLGIKILNPSGLGEEAAGTITDNTGQEVMTFKTLHAGMGNLILNPLPGKTYTAKITFRDGSVQVVPLPAAQPSGYVLSVNVSDTTKITGRILLSEALLKDQELKVAVQYNNSIIAVLRTRSGKQVSAFTLNRTDLPQGIIRFTLFSAGNIPVAERLIFNYAPAKNMAVSLSGLKASYSRRELAELRLHATDAGKASAGSFSVAVTNSGTVVPDPENETNMLTSLLLTSDLKGYVEKPNYYLLTSDPQTRADADNLMLTQGWTRLRWKDLLSGEVRPQPFTAEKFLKVSGNVTTSSGKPVPGGRVSLFSTSGGVFLLDTLTDARGHFEFNNLTFGDSTRFVVQARNAKNKKDVEIRLDIVPGQVVTKNKNTGDIEVNVNETLQHYILKSDDYFADLQKKGLLQRSYVLDQVNIVQKKSPVKNSANLNGSGNADAIITAKDLGTCVTLSQCLQGRVAGLIIRNGMAYLMRNNGAPMQIIVDGMNVQPDFLDNIQPFDVETIEVLKNIGNTAIYGFRGSAGILLITTKRGGGDLSYNRYAPGIITYAPKGFYAIRQFYSPQYKTEQPATGQDQRSTVFWAPHVPADLKGNGNFSFYTTDESGTYRIVIEGINDSGHPARSVYTYQVK